MRFLNQESGKSLDNMRGGGILYRDIVQEVFMKRTIIAALSILLMLFAFRMQAAGNAISGTG